MKAFLKQNFAIVLAFALPLLLIAGVAASTYVPSLFLKTDYDFIYVVCTDGGNYYYSSRCTDDQLLRYAVVEGVVVENEIDPTQDLDKNNIPDVQERYKARLFLHDTSTNESREITLEEAQVFTVSDKLTSPDGVTVSSEYDRGADFLFFGGASTYGYYLTKGSSKVRLDLINDDGRYYYYRDSFRFIGWIVE